MSTELLLTVWVDGEFDEVARIDLLVMEKDIFIDQNLKILVIVVEVYRVEAIRWGFRLLFELLLRRAV
jgi:hypothetical protein